METTVAREPHLPAPRASVRRAAPPSFSRPLRRRRRTPTHRRNGRRNTDPTDALPNAPTSRHVSTHTHRTVKWLRISIIPSSSTENYNGPHRCIVVNTGDGYLPTTEFLVRVCVSSGSSAVHGTSTPVYHRNVANYFYYCFCTLFLQPPLPYATAGIPIINASSRDYFASSEKSDTHLTTKCDHNWLINSYVYMYRQFLKVVFHSKVLYPFIDLNIWFAIKIQRNKPMIEKNKKVAFRVRPTTIILYS